MWQCNGRGLELENECEGFKSSLLQPMIPRPLGLS
jgi:hypothetical protein